MSIKFSKWRPGISAALIGAAVYVSSGIATTAIAADAPTAQEAATAAPLEEIVITGSRIPVPVNINSTSPIQSVSAQEIAASGKSDTFDLIMALPQNVNNAGSDFGNSSNPLNGPGGITTADLRGLGPQRTLVLVDGRRLGIGDVNTGNQNPAPDLDQIPAALVERVDVVTGGASAVYGSDAMAGVINFIMRKNFQGVEVDGKFGMYQHSNNDGILQNLETISGVTPPTGSKQDGFKRDLSIVLGTNVADGAGNVTAYFVYHNQDPVTGAARDFADCLLTSTGATSYACGNSSNSNQFVVGATPYAVVGNQFVPWSASANTSPPPTFNSNSYEFLQRGDERYQAGTFAHLDLNDAVKPYLEFSFMDDRTREIVGPSGLFKNNNPTIAGNKYLVNCSNPLLSAQEAGILCPGGLGNAAPVNGLQESIVNIGRRNIEGGGRDDFFEHTNYRVVVGANGDFLDAWKYDAYAQYYYTQFYNSQQQYLNYAAVNNALQVTGTAANPVCVVGAPCVPYNIFNQGAVTPAQLAYLAVPGTAFGTNSEQTVHADVTGDLGKYHIVSPWAKDGVGINVGFERRLDNVDFLPDASLQSGDLAGGNLISPVAASYNVKEGFIEARAPLAQGLPGIYDLDVDAGYRISDYSTSAGTTHTYKFEVQYAPIPDVRLRYSYDRAVRAPNLLDLYEPQSYGQQAVFGVDPCAPAAPGLTATASLAACERTGVTPAEYGNGSSTNTISQCVAGQCGQVLGGNTHLKPEQADTYSLGMSVTPTALPEFNATIDYWHITLFDVLNAIPPNVLFNGCISGATPQYCSAIVRTPDGSLTGATVAGGGYIFQGAINTASEEVSGIDVQMNYRLPLGDSWGSLGASLSGTWLQQWKSTPFVGAHTYDCAGLFGVTCNNGVNPTWRHNLRLTWATPWKAAVSVQWRYIGSTGFDNNSPDPTLHGGEVGFFDQINARIPSYSYIDMSASWKFATHFEVRAGVNNLFDREPPVIPSNGITGVGTPNSYPTYDFLGRELFVGFKAHF